MKRKRKKQPDEIIVAVGTVLFTILGVVLIWKQVLLLAGPAQSNSYYYISTEHACDRCGRTLRGNGKCRFCDEDYDKCTECGGKLYFIGSHPEGMCAYCGTDDYFPLMPYIAPVIE